MDTTIQPHLPTHVPHHVTRFADSLADSLVAMARYWDNLPGHNNAPDSKMNYVAVIQPETSYDQVRRAFGGGGGTLPSVIDDDLYAFAADVVPVLAGRLNRGDWWGENPGAFAADASFAAQVSSMALRLMDASVLLASDKLSDKERSLAERKLDRLTFLFEVDETLPIPLRFAACYATLEAMIEEVDTLPRVALELDRDESIACLPGVRAIYEEIDSGIFAIESGEALLDIDWETVRENFAPNFGRIQFTTTSLLPILAQHDLAVAFAIDRFRLYWGQNILQDISASKEQLIRNAAQTVLRLYTDELPHGYIHAANDDALGVHIHDIQNEFLKVQFQYDLLTMICDIPKLPAPRLHVDRKLARMARIDHLRLHLRDWLMLYQTLLEMVRRDAVAV